MHQHKQEKASGFYSLHFYLLKILIRSVIQDMQCHLPSSSIFRSFFHDHEIYTYVIWIKPNYSFYAYAYIVYVVSHIIYNRTGIIWVLQLIKFQNMR
jgi:hypothetical protein